MKVIKIGAGWRHWCPACNNAHFIQVDEPQANGAQWTFDGNELRPTFNPRMNIRWGRYVDPKWLTKGGVCHYFLQGGVIKYLPDCTHGMAGQEVPLPHLPNRAMAR